MTPLINQLSHGTPSLYQTFDDNADRKSPALTRQLWGDVRRCQRRTAQAQ
ncbi:hypothetical protein NKT77_01440 [Moraxella sp. FZLJ2107]|nr:MULTISPECIES: hypothetical protein [unclassified Moraxella]UTO05346.1 hypothetical protein NKT77_01440 [Moraxella sp. FZLJ2107]UTO22081.1 hypothetical protein NKU06_09740 [Moraxella sp. FZLJ2109]